MKKSFVLGAAAVALAVLPALAQDAVPQKFPTPPPPVTAENSIIGPGYADAPESIANPAVPQGEVHEFILYSEDSKIYPGIVRIHDMQRDANGNYIQPPGGLSAPGRYERHVYVYIPKQLAPGTPAPFMVVQDGHSYVKRMVNMMDNMIAAKRLPPMVLVFADSGGSDAQGSERGLEYDTVSDRYSNWVEQELLPAVTQRTRRDLHHRSGRPRHPGRKLGRRRGFHHGLVSSGALSQGAQLFRHLRESGLAGRSRQPRAAPGNITIT